MMTTTGRRARARGIPFLLLPLFLVALTGTGWGQGATPFPPPDLPDPGGGGTLAPPVQKLLDNAMKRMPPGQPPFGTDGAGNAAWPMQDPVVAFVRTAPPAAAGPQSFADAGDGGGDTPGTLLEKLHTLPARGVVTGEELRPLLDTALAAEPGAFTGRPVRAWPAGEAVRMKYAFLYDLQRHARFVFEGRNDLALAVALKWQVIGQLHRDQIETVTLDIARRQSAPSFERWIEGIVAEDRRNLP